MTERNGQIGPRYWVGVVSREHVQRGVAGGFAQVCHGKERHLRRLQAGDWLIYYSPTTQRGEGDTVQSFTAIGKVTDDIIYTHAMSETFVPFRRNVAYLPARDASIRPLLPHLSFTRERERWGYVFRTGLFEIDRQDFEVIADAMGVTAPPVEKPLGV